MSFPDFMTVIEGTSPLVATAIHNGHFVRPELEPLFGISESDRLCEEDPFTGVWTAIAPTQIILHKSRFEVDVNRPKHKAVYLNPEDAWGLNVWNKKISPDIFSRSLAQYDYFYSEMKQIFKKLRKEHGSFVVFDLHSYNCKRKGPPGPLVISSENPDVNIGTEHMNRRRFAGLVDRFAADLARFDFLGRKLDVRENVKFKGGYFSDWTFKEFGDSACVLSVEFKKFFMDEQTGIVDTAQLEAVGRLLTSTVPGVLEELSKLK